MITRVDRIQIATPDPRGAAKACTTLVGAEHARDDRVTTLGARRNVYRLGTSEIELLEPDGTGPVADAVSKRGAHLFAGGLATEDLEGLVARLRSKAVDARVENGQAHLFKNVPYVVSEWQEREPAGLADFLYEITDLRADARAWSARYADLFGLDESGYVPIVSEGYGYRGALTMFDPKHERLDRIECIHPYDETKTMGRYFAKFGESLYMCYCETGRQDEILERARAQDAPHTAGNSLFLHPKALGGVMLGVSRRTLAWSWSGHPDRVQPA